MWEQEGRVTRVWYGEGSGYQQGLGAGRGGGRVTRVWEGGGGYQGVTLCLLQVGGLRRVIVGMANGSENWRNNDQRWIWGARNLRGGDDHKYLKYEIHHCGATTTPTNKQP